MMKFLSILCLSIVGIVSCKKDRPPQLPSVTTSAITVNGITEASGGGIITNNGGSEITASGLVYSSTSIAPTLADSKTEETATTGTFTSTLSNLTSGTTYHVRAYATNSVGTGYGGVVDFITGNAAPEATNVTIDGTVEAGLEVTASYTYSDAESDAESGTTFQWYVADDLAGSGEVTIAEATSASYTINPLYEFKYLRVAITPKSASGTPTGTEVKSAFSQVAESTNYEVFTYNGKVVAYGIIKSSATGRKWLDRDLGAQRAATGTQDHLAYGDLFQWGRLADGHQLMTWVTDKYTDDPDGTLNVRVNGLTDVASESNVPGHSLFITYGPRPTYDWLEPQNATRWQTPDYPNNPCPEGWHIPTVAEWSAEIDGVKNGNQLKLVAAGQINSYAGNLLGPGFEGYYWSSDVYLGTYIAPQYFRMNVDLETGEVTEFKYKFSYYAASGLSCRCIKNE